MLGVHGVLEVIFWEAKANSKAGHDLLCNLMTLHHELQQAWSAQAAQVTSSTLSQQAPVLELPMSRSMPWLQIHFVSGYAYSTYCKSREIDKSWPLI